MSFTFKPKHPIAESIGAEIIGKEFIELRIGHVCRSKEKVLELMKTALNNPEAIKLNFVVNDKLLLASKIKELEKTM